MALHPLTYHNLTVSDGTNLAYTEAGSPSHPLLLLLHGFPSSSNQFRNLIPLLSPTHHILAPDLPGFGLTTSPANYNFTFANLAQTISLFLAALHITRDAVYVFDYGAPIAFRLALKSPESITAIISQKRKRLRRRLRPPLLGPHHCSLGAQHRHQPQNPSRRVPDPRRYQTPI